jgi:hypothetical protein
VCVALLGGSIVAPHTETAHHSSVHVEVDASEPPMGDGEFLKLGGDWGSEMTHYVNRRFWLAGWHCIPLHRPISVISSGIALYYVYYHTET